MDADASSDVSLDEFHTFWTRHVLPELSAPAQQLAELQPALEAKDAELKALEARLGASAAGDRH